MWGGELTITVTHNSSGWDPQRGCAAKGEARGGGGVVKRSVAAATVRTEQGAVTGTSVHAICDLEMHWGLPPRFNQIHRGL